MSYSIPLIKPYMSESIKKRVLDVLDSGYLTEGPVTKELENVFAKYIGVKHAIAATSCTTGLEMAVRALGIGYGNGGSSDDEVIVPDYTYPATATAIAIAGATPVIVDVEKDTQLISREAVEKAITKNTRAIMPVSIFGNPLDYSWLNELKEKHNLYIIEDAACSIGAEWNGKKVGTFADISVFSLHPRKFITTGEGGMITTNNDELAAWMNSYKHFGIGDTEACREGIQFVRTGTNYKLSNVQAAIGLGQMEVISELFNERQRLAKRYFELLQGIKSVTLPAITENGIHSWQTFYVCVDKRDSIMQSMRSQGIEVQIGTYSLHKHSAFTEKPYVLCEDFAGSTYCFESTLALPMYHGMSEDEQASVVDMLRKEVASE